MMLVISDRDGTLIDLVDYLGKGNNWRDELKLNYPVIDLLKYIQKNYESKFFVVSNQQGVARKYFDCRRVEEINSYLDEKLRELGIKMDGWDYCPDVDVNYVGLHPEIEFDPDYVKKETRRKPSSKMILESLDRFGLSISSFEHILILGDSEDDGGLAKNLEGKFIDVKGKDYKQLQEEFNLLFGEIN